MTMETQPPQDSTDSPKRVERLRAERERRHRRRRNAVLAAAGVAVAICLAAGGYIGWRIVKARRTPPPLLTYSIIIPEGFTIGQTAGRVAESTSGRVSAAAFEKATKGSYPYTFLEGTDGNLEGFLFPKTYEVTELESARDVVKRMLEQFDEETSELDWTKADALGITPYQAVIIASLIEKEVKAPDERPLVASVVYNRLKQNMKLGFCSTVQYALGEPKPALTESDLKVDSPYNTYLVEGLPPTPICSPGFESIRAALNPAATDYLYFILTSPAEGRHSFTSDYQQFEKWKQEQNNK